MKAEYVETSTLLVLLCECLGQQVRRTPALTLAAAGGVGYVLGAGVPSVVLRAGATLAVRAAVLAAVVPAWEALTTDGTSPDDAHGRDGHACPTEAPLGEVGS